MIRPVSKPRTVVFLNDFQVFKGQCSATMKTFGQPVAAEHEADLLIRDDRRTLAPGATALYAVHQRSENRIISIVEAVGGRKARPVASLPKAA